MTLKSSSDLALVGMLVLTVLLAADFIRTFVGILHDVVPMVALLRSLVYLFAGITVAVFFYVFNRAQR